MKNMNHVLTELMAWLEDNMASDSELHFVPFDVGASVSLTTSASTCTGVATSIDHTD
ncbi:hypothetical protein VII00023_18514 [Vibrio ichthyoenteri ATCC 700023]|uniref:Uncharacterized protein n=1 Tax=Vibrio ichthyoenteri ATCC 700023 TaxID=870968 RepID=F9S3P1_9VIBR|nr:hypothetical protein VII00023_18514 [Vibrio ichthyoenteri ATCC 700023]